MYYVYNMCAIRVRQIRFVRKVHWVLQLLVRKQFTKNKIKKKVLKILICLQLSDSVKINVLEQIISHYPIVLYCNSMVWCGTCYYVFPVNERALACSCLVETHIIINDKNNTTKFKDVIFFELVWHKIHWKIM